jgi:uncharacterized protein
VTPLTGQSLTVSGPAGALEALLEDPDPSIHPVHCMVICHPHSLHGGTLHNKVVTMLARSAQSLGAPTLRFNFRGVGKSAGEFDEGRGEIDDAVAAVAYVRQRWPNAALWLAGFSFGGYIALRASTTRGVGQVSRLVTVAPALARHYGSVRDVDAPHCPWLIVQGDADEVLDANVIIEWAKQLDSAPTLAVLPGVGHYFHGKLIELRNLVVPFLEG